jgi:hypothetical protein
MQNMTARPLGWSWSGVESAFRLASRQPEAGAGFQAHEGDDPACLPEPCVDAVRSEAHASRPRWRSRAGKRSWPCWGWGSVWNAALPGSWGERFVTAVVAEIGSAHGVVFLDYGHPAPRVVRRDCAVDFPQPLAYALPLGLGAHGSEGPTLYRVVFAPGEQFQLGAPREDLVRNTQVPPRRRRAAVAPPSRSWGRKNCSHPVSEQRLRHGRKEICRSVRTLRGPWTTWMRSPVRC